MMRIAPAAKAFVFARAFPTQRNVAFTALRMMSSAAPSVKVSLFIGIADFLGELVLCEDVVHGITEEGVSFYSFFFVGPPVEFLTFSFISVGRNSPPTLNSPRVPAKSALDTTFPSWIKEFLDDRTAQKLERNA
jgi:hypothetical protein